MLETSRSKEGDFGREGKQQWSWTTPFADTPVAVATGTASKRPSVLNGDRCETTLMKPIIGVFAIGLLAATPAFASGQYHELWNPPEARGGNVNHVQIASRSPVRRRVSAHNYRHHVHRPVVAAASVPQSPVRAPTHQSSRLTFNDIPRQITPEGNILRVAGAHASGKVER
jgi:hypothetical protein